MGFSKILEGISDSMRGCKLDKIEINLIRLQLSEIEGILQLIECDKTDEDSIDKDSVDERSGWKMYDYGGKLTYLSTLEVGEKFRVLNGGWFGQIVEDNGVKKLKVEHSNSLRDIPDNYCAYI